MPKDLFADFQCLVIILFYQKIIYCGYSVCHKFCRQGPFQATFSPDPDKPQTRLNQTFPGPQCDGTCHGRGSHKVDRQVAEINGCF